MGYTEYLDEVLDDQVLGVKRIRQSHLLWQVFERIGMVFSWLRMMTILSTLATCVQVFYLPHSHRADLPVQQNRHHK